MGDEKKWVGTTYGNSWMHRTLIRILRRTDIRVVYLFTAIFVVPVCLLLRNRNYRTIYRYFRHRFHYAPLRAFLATYRNHCLFGQVVIDRFAMYAGKKFNVTVIGYEHFKTLAQAEEGFVQLSAHVGNYELAGYTLKAEGKPINALVFGGEKATVMEHRNQMFHQTNIHMIPIQPDMSHLYAINRALEHGEIMSMPADRAVGSPKTITMDFLDGTAKFPMGPFTVAALWEANVLAVNVMKSAPCEYTIYVTPIDYDKTAPRKQQVEQIAKNYVGELERIVTLYPTQWYNYFEFWTK